MLNERIKRFKIAMIDPISAISNIEVESVNISIKESSGNVEVMPNQIPSMKLITNALMRSMIEILYT